MTSRRRFPDRLSKISVARCRTAFKWMIAVALSLTVASGMTLDVTPSISSPVSVGTRVTFAVSSPDAAPGTLWYRFRVRATGGDFSMIRDYGPLNSLDWSATSHEGIYDLEVSVRNTATGDVATTDLQFLFTT